MNLPKRLPETDGKYAALFRWLNQLRDAVSSQQPMPGRGTTVTRQINGFTVSIEPVPPAQGGGGSSVPRWG